MKRRRTPTERRMFGARTGRAVLALATALLAGTIAAPSPATAADQNGYVFNDPWTLIDPGSLVTDDTPPGVSDATGAARTSIPLRTGAVGVDLDFVPGGAQIDGVNYLTTTPTQDSVGAGADTFVGSPTTTDLPGVGVETNASYCDGPLGSAAHQNFSGVCADSGTLTFRFDRAVTDPVLDVSGIGGWRYAFQDGYGRGSFLAQEWTLVSEGITLSGPLGDAPTNIVVDGDVVRPAFAATSGRCDRTDKSEAGTRYESPDADLAGCGSIRLNGTMTEAAFRIDTSVSPWSEFPPATYSTGGAYFANDGTRYADGINGLNVVADERVLLPGDVTASQSDFALVSIRVPQNGSLGDLVWEDVDRDGVAGPGEPGVQGVTVVLLDDDGAPVRDTAGDPITTVTAADGTYRFDDLPLGEYRVGFEDVPAGWTFTAQGVGTDATIDSDADPATGVTDVVTLTSDRPTDLDVDAGLVRPLPDFGFTKTAEPPTGSTVDRGDTVTYTITGSNTGETALDPVTITDDLSDVLDDADLDGAPTAEVDGSPTTAPVVSGTVLTWTGALDPGEVVTITITVVVHDDATGELVNAATAEATSSDGDTLTPAPVTTRHPVASIAVVKDASLDGPGVAGDVITYTFTVTNTGTAPLVGVSIEDELSGLSDVSYVWPDPNSPGELEPGESATATASYVLRQDDVDSGAVDNLATVTGAPECPGCGPVTDSDGTTTPLDRTAVLDLTKTASLDGDVITYTFTIVNTGTVTLTDVTVADDMDGLSEISYEWPDPDRPGVLAPGGTATATAAYVVTDADRARGEVRNGARAVGVPPGDVEPPVASDTVETDLPGVDVGPGDLPVTGGSPVGLVAFGAALIVAGTWVARRSGVRG